MSTVDFDISYGPKPFRSIYVNGCGTNKSLSMDICIQLHSHLRYTQHKHISSGSRLTISSRTLFFPGICCTPTRALIRSRETDRGLIQTKIKRLIRTSTMAMAASNSSSLKLTVERCEPEMVAPARPTPHELKPLSDIDDQEGLRFQQPVIMFYRPNSDVVDGKDPVQVIREALAEALVYYYPLAGRIKEGPARKLMVDCTGEGVLFVEANANVRFEQLEEEASGSLLPSIPCMENLFYNKADALTLVIDYPVLTIQVTRLLCGGFVVALCYNHTLTDGTGSVQFLTTVAEIARGASIPSVLPIWQRELLTARDPPRVTHTHREYEVNVMYDEVLDELYRYNVDNKTVSRYFFIGPQEVAAIRSHLSPDHQQQYYSSFELLTACLWRCRTLALEYDPSQEVRVSFAVSARRRFENPPLPEGYYGYTCAYPAAVSTAGNICSNPLSYALGLVKEAKESVTEEYMKSLADFMVVNDRRPIFNVTSTYHVSDILWLGFNDIDFGWGKPVYGGPTHNGTFDHCESHFNGFTNHNEEYGRMVSIFLPVDAMDRFVNHLESLLK